MNTGRQLGVLANVLCMAAAFVATAGGDVKNPASTAPLPDWDLETAHREASPTRERISINGLWRWQPASADDQQVPEDAWGHFKVPGCWPGITNYMQKDCQTVHAHQAWQDRNLRSLTAAWYQREIRIPDAWRGRRIVLTADTLNSYAVVFLDGRRAGEMRYPSGELELTSNCIPGRKHLLSLLVVALPLKGVMLSYQDSNSAREVQGSVDRRGLCGDVSLLATPSGPRVRDFRVATSVSSETITLDCALADLRPGIVYGLKAEVTDGNGVLRELASPPFRAGELQGGKVQFTDSWPGAERWDIHSPENQYRITVSLTDASGQVLDASLPVRFGFREFRIEGRDFYLNGTRIFLSAVPLDNAQIGAAWSTYEAATTSLRRLRSFGINAVYTHNYGCQPGSHLSFTEILRAADDVGMLVAFSQPHFSHYDWTADDAERTNGYAGHAEAYVAVAGNHPSVVMYSMNHNATGYAEDMNPDLIDGIQEVRDRWSQRNAQRALRAEAIVRKLDPDRIVYHHSSGNLGSMHTSNFYPNWVPIQEMSDWFEHWATAGVKPFFSCEFGAPFLWDWAMYRGWYQGKREFGSAPVPWHFCLAEWNSQFTGDAAFRISEEEARNLRWEARQFRAGNVWHRWDYPHQLGSSDFDERYPILTAYLTDNWRAFRTWGVSAISPWEHRVYWRPRPGLDRNRRVEFEDSQQDLQRPGFRPDYLEDRYERMDLAYEMSDWVATSAAEALVRNNGPLLAYLAGKPERFTTKDHNFQPGQVVEKQLILINNSRERMTADCAWRLTVRPTKRSAVRRPGGKDGPSESRGVEVIAEGTARAAIETGEQTRFPIRIPLPADLPPGEYPLQATASFGNGETQTDQFAIHVLESAAAEASATGRAIGAGVRVAVFDPEGETTDQLNSIRVAYDPVTAETNLSQYDLLIIGKAAMPPSGPVPDIRRVRDGLKVIVFEQTSETLEQRLGFRVQEYGLRNVFPRVPDHPYLAGLDAQHLRDWRGAATLLSPRLQYETSERYNGVPAVSWCGIEVPRLWRCGNYGNVASVLIEKPAIGDFLPIVDGGFSLQYSPLLEYREGSGMILFCQMDVTGRTEGDPAAVRLLRNILAYVAGPGEPVLPARSAVYAGSDSGRRHLERTGIAVRAFAGGDLTDRDVLIVGQGGGSMLAPHAAGIARWLESGGSLLGLGLDADEANLFLPRRIRTVSREHIATAFEAPGHGTVFRGLGPADVHNRDPRDLPLLSGGASVLGNGVLGRMEDASIVFCQIEPHRWFAASGEAAASADGVDSGGREPLNLRMTYRRSSALVTRLLANLGVRGETPLLDRFATPVEAEAVSGDTDGRWARGLYVDLPQAWDDPYRFFRW